MSVSSLLNGSLARPALSWATVSPLLSTCTGQVLPAAAASVSLNFSRGVRTQSSKRPRSMGPDAHGAAQSVNVPQPIEPLPPLPQPARASGKRSSIAQGQSRSVQTSSTAQGPAVAYADARQPVFNISPAQLGRLLRPLNIPSAPGSSPAVVDDGDSAYSTAETNYSIQPGAETWTMPAPFHLDLGGVLEPVTLAYETWGTLSRCVHVCARPPPV